MDIKEALKPTKPRIINSAGVYLVYLFFTYLQSFQCCKEWMLCPPEETRRVVLTIYPGAHCCQVCCATTNELILGYVLMVLLRVIIPAIATYVIVSLAPLLVKKLSEEMSY